MNKTLYSIYVALAVVGGFLMGASGFHGTLFYVGIAIAAVALVLMVVSFYTKKKNIRKNRSITMFDVRIEKEKMEQVIKDFLAKKGFALTDYVNNEQVYRLGSGVWTARKYLTYHFQENKLILESWISMSSGKGTGDEMPLDNGFFAKVPKSQLKKIIDELATTIANANKEQ